MVVAFKAHGEERDKNKTEEGRKERDEGGGELKRKESKRGCRENARTQGPSVLSFAWR